MAHRDAAVLKGSDRRPLQGAPPRPMMPKGCLGSPAIVALRSGQRLPHGRRTEARKTNRGRVAGPHHSSGEPLLCANAIAVSMDVRRGDQLGGAITPPNGCGGRIWTAQSACPLRPAEGGAGCRSQTTAKRELAAFVTDRRSHEEKGRGTGPLGREDFRVRTDR